MKKPASKHTWQLLAEFPLAASPSIHSTQENPVDSAIQGIEEGLPIRDDPFENAIQAIGSALPKLPRKSLARLQATLAERIRRAAEQADGDGTAASVQVCIRVDGNADRLKPGWGFFIVEKGQPTPQGRIEVFFYAEGNDEGKAEI